MPVFSLLADSRGYRADTWDFRGDPAGRTYWLEKLAKGFALALQAAEQSLVTDAAKLREAIAGAQQGFADVLGTLRDHPEQLGVFTLRGMDHLREKVLNQFGLQDPFFRIKYQENVKACSHYARLIKAHERLTDDSLVRVLTEGILAGQVFDPGTGQAGSRYEEGMDFYHVLNDLPPRPWLVDDCDRWHDYFVGTGKTIKRVMLFVDNSGADFVLGCVPLARALAKRGATVILAANEPPCYNDVTAAEGRAVLRALAEDDEVLRFLLRTKRLRVNGIDNGCPQLDFRTVPASLNEAAAGTDLLIMTGSPRTIQSNWEARFRCSSLKLAMLKDAWEAARLGGKMYDLVCRFERAQG